MQELYRGVLERGGQDWAVEKQGRASVDPQGSSGAGMMQIEAGNQALYPPSINHGAQTGLGGRLPVGKASALCASPVGRSSPSPSPPKVDLEHFVSSAGKGPLSFSSRELQRSLQVQVHTLFPLALNSTDRYGRVHSSRLPRVLTKREEEVDINTCVVI